MQLYKESLNYNKITYLILEIKKYSFEKFDFIMSSYLTIFIISKIKIFVDNINIVRDFEYLIKLAFF